MTAISISNWHRYLSKWGNREEVQDAEKLKNINNCNFLNQERVKATHFAILIMKN